MRPKIENLKELALGSEMNKYQKALALNEYIKLIEYVDKLEKELQTKNIQSNFGQARSDNDDYDFSILRRSDNNSDDDYGGMIKHFKDY